MVPGVAKLKRKRAEEFNWLVQPGAFGMVRTLHAMASTACPTPHIEDRNRNSG